MTWKALKKAKDLEVRVAQDGVVLTDAQLSALK
jgi:hypothetical protein